MSDSSQRVRARREFLRFLAASPLIAYGLEEAWAQESAPSLVKDVLSVMDFEALAKSKLPAAHWGYMASGTDDNLTLQANVAAYKNIQLRPRRLVDVSKIDTGIELFGQRFPSPIFLCPVGGHRMFHADGEVATARAARAKGALQVLSTQTSIAVEEVAAARGGGLWYQLYMPSTWEDTEKMVRRVEAAGCPVLVWTVDLLGGRNLETATRAQRTDTRQCAACHATATGGRRNSEMFSGLSGARFNPPNATWDWVERLKKMTSMKVVIKGIETGEDARLAVEHGADGIVVSNHGGRAAESLRPTIDAVPEVVDAVNNQIPVLVDGGVRRGSDAFKAIAYGARAVGIGRPYTWGLTAFGQDGVERVLDILNAELNLTMRQCGTPTLGQITKGHVRQARVTGGIPHIGYAPSQAAR